MVCRESLALMRLQNIFGLFGKNHILVKSLQNESERVGRGTKTLSFVINLGVCVFAAAATSEAAGASLM